MLVLVIADNLFKIEVCLKIGIIFPKDSEALFNVNSQRPYGGANIQLFQIARQMLSNKDIKLFSLITDYDIVQFPESHKFNIVRTFKESDSFIKKIIKTHKIIKENKIDYLIQRGLTFESCLMAFYCYLFKIKFIFMFAHDIETLGRYQSNRNKCMVFNILLTFSHKLIVQNRLQYNNISNKTNKSKISIIKKGLDLNKIKSLSTNLEKEFDCIWIARCDEWKNPEDYIRLAEVHKDRKFLMIAPPAIGKEAYYNSLIEKIRSVKNIVYYDFVDNDKIYELLIKSKVFCITSDIEGDWPMVVLEAAAVGVPILSLKINYDDLIDTYSGGIYCDSDINVLMEKFKLLVSDSELNRNLSENAVRFIYENHDIVENVKKLVKEISAK